MFYSLSLILLPSSASPVTTTPTPHHCHTTEPLACLSRTPISIMIDNTLLLNTSAAAAEIISQQHPGFSTKPTAYCADPGSSVPMAGVSACVIRP